MDQAIVLLLERSSPTVYRIDGSGDLAEEELSHLHGYRGSRPVCIGNPAARQFQLDVTGHVLEAAFLCYVRMPREVDEELWEALKDLADLAARNWREPDCGIWEDRSTPRHYLHSKLYCWVAVDRALRLAEKFELPDENELWRKALEETRQLILDQGYDTDLGAFRQALDADGSDATSLILARVGLLPASDERVQSTVRHIRSTLGEEGLIYRRRRAEASPDEGIFLLCNFWLVDVLIDSGQREEAEELFQRILRFGNDVGLFPEEVDPSTGEWLGNFPRGARFPNVTIQVGDLLNLSDNGLLPAAAGSLEATAAVVANLATLPGPRRGPAVTCPQVHRRRP